MSHKILLELKDNIHAKLKDIKEISGQVVTQQIKAYIYRGLLADGYVSLKELKEEENFYHKKGLHHHKLRED